MVKRKIRVMVVEDSRFYQAYLCKVIEADPYLEVAGVAASGKEARRLIRELNPDVITLDIHLEDVAGFELLQYLLKYANASVIVVSSLPEACEEAINMGASDFIQKITDDNRFSPEQFSSLLQMKIKMQAYGSTEGVTSIRQSSRDKHLLKNKGRHRIQNMLIGIGASVGGTESTLEILSKLPEDTPPILIVQHIAEGFVRPYAMRLDQKCRLDVSEVKDGERLHPGMVRLASSGKHMMAMRDENGYYVRSVAGKKIGGFCPSVDVLFSSMAETGGSGIGVILTGMGHDGRDGIQRMHSRGFYTVGQEEKSCVVFGMSQEAYKAGALDELLTPEQIASRIIEQCGLQQNRR